jgi:hypothetical protein
MSRECYYRKLAGCGLRAKKSAKGKSIYSRHFKVEHDEVGRVLVK